METIHLSERRYNELLAAEKLLRHLEANGVANWEGYPIPEDEDEDEDDDCSL